MNNILQYNTSEASTALNVTPKVVRGLCSSGLIPYVKRDRLGHRVFTEDQLNHARVILGLRQAGLKKAELRRYTNLVRQGDSTLAERKALLETERRQAWQRHDSIQHNIDFMERQIELIDQELASYNKDFSHNV